MVGRMKMIKAVFLATMMLSVLLLPFFAAAEERVPFSESGRINVIVFVYEGAMSARFAHETVLQAQALQAIYADKGVKVTAEYYVKGMPIARNWLAEDARDVTIEDNNDSHWRFAQDTLRMKGTPMLVITSADGTVVKQQNNPGKYTWDDPWLLLSASEVIDGML